MKLYIEVLTDINSCLILFVEKPSKGYDLVLFCPEFLLAKSPGLTAWNHIKICKQVISCQKQQYNLCVH